MEPGLLSFELHLSAFVSVSLISCFLGVCLSSCPLGSFSILVRLLASDIAVVLSETPACPPQLCHDYLSASTINSLFQVLAWETSLSEPDAHPHGQDHVGGISKRRSRSEYFLDCR